ncbi:MAG TPA: hypothetical protein VF791_21480 [Pyrinomonadaceae bacterium]
MKFLKLLTLAAIVQAGALCAFAQKPTCQVKQAPEFNGFHLGMSALDVKDLLFDSSLFDSKMSAVNKTGTQAVRLSGAELKDEYAEGIDEVNLTFVDKRLAIIKATYNGAVTWRNAEDFFKQVSEKLGLPQSSASAQTRGSRGNEKYRFDCTDFAVTLAYSFGVSPSITIANTIAQKMVDERSERNPDGQIKEINVTPTMRPPRPNPPR